MDHGPKNSMATPFSNRRADYARRAPATPVPMRVRRLNHKEDAKLDIIDVTITLISTIAVVAANGAVFLIMGNALLQSSSYNYTDIASAAKIGGAGGIIAAPAITILLAILRVLPRNAIVDLILGFLSDFGDIPLGAMSGYFGVVVLAQFAANVDGNIDAVGAAWAGALGGVIGAWRRDFNTVVVQE